VPVDDGAPVAEPIVGVDGERIVPVAEREHEFHAVSVLTHLVAGEPQLQLPGPVGEADRDLRVAEAEGRRRREVERDLAAVLERPGVGDRIVEQRDRLLRCEAGTPVQAVQPLPVVDVQHGAGRRGGEQPQSALGIMVNGRSVRGGHSVLSNSWAGRRRP
jgi:hypothetical protein